MTMSWSRTINRIYSPDIPLLLVLLLFLAAVTIAEPNDDGEDRLTLLPLHIDDFEDASGHVKRSGLSKLDHLAPSEVAELAYGNSGEERDAFTLANMTLHAPSGSPLVTMERFEGLTSAVDCNDDDGELSLTFKSKDVFDAAHKAWKYINDDEDANFLLITNHDGCGPENQRQVYRIAKVDNDDASLTTKLYATVAPWKEVSGTFSMDWRQVKLTPKGSRRLRVRGLDLLSKRRERRDPHPTNNTTTDLSHSNNLKPRFGEIELFHWDAPGEPAEVNVGDELLGAFPFVYDITKFPPRVQAWCEGCWINTKLKVGGTLRTENFIALGLDVEITFVEFEAFYNLLWKIAIEKDYFTTKTAPKQKYQETFEKELLSLPIPGVGYALTDTLDIGLYFSFAFYAEMQTFARFDFYTPVRSNFPKGSTVKFDVLKMKKGVKFDLGDAEWTTDVSFEPRKGNLEANIMMYPGPALEFGVKVWGETVGAKTQLILRAPAIHMNVTGGYNEKGWCKQAPGVAKWGGQVTGSKELQLWGKAPRPGFDPSKGKGKFFKGLEWKNYFQHRFWSGEQYGHFKFCRGLTIQGPDLFQNPDDVPDPGPPPKPKPPPSPKPEPPPAESCEVDGRKGICKIKGKDPEDGGYFAKGKPTGDPPRWPCTAGEDHQCFILGDPPPPNDEDCEVDGRHGFCREQNPDKNNCEDGYWEPGTGPPWPCSGGLICCIRGFEKPKPKPPGKPEPKPDKPLPGHPDGDCKSPMGTGKCVPREKCRGRSYTEGLCPDSPQNVQCCVEQPCEGSDPTPAPLEFLNLDKSGGPKILKGWCRHESQGCEGDAGDVPLPLGNQRHEWRDIAGDSFKCPEDQHTKCCVAVQ